MCHHEIVMIIAASALPILAITPMFLILMLSKTGKELVSKWLTPKIALTALVVAFICWNVYKMRCAYEIKCKDAVKAYSTLTSKE